MNITGVSVAIRGKEYGFHEKCADNLIQQLVDAGFSIMDQDMPAVIIGPIFDNDFICAHSECLQD